MTGIVGDDVMGWPTRLLFVTGQSRHNLLRSEVIFRSGYMGGVSCRFVTTPTIVARPECMTASIGFDNTDLLPPFLPCLRSEDGLAGVVLAMVDPSATSMYVPVLLEHRRATPVTRRAEDIWCHTRPRLSHLVIELLMRGRVKEYPRTATGLNDIGAFLSSVSAVRSKEFQWLCREVWRKACQRRRGEIGASLEVNQNAPQFWADAMRAFERQLLADENNALPIDIPQRGTTETQWNWVRAAVGRYARLLVEWPQMWKAAQEVDLV
jgi:hypothetical protein